MGERVATAIEVVSADAELEWDEVPRPQGDSNPPGEETIVFRTADRAMSCGFWRRVPEAGTLAPPFDEIMMILRGEIEITPGDGDGLGVGEVLRVGPGDVLSAPNGSRAGWRSLSPVYKFWAVHHGDVGDTTVRALLGAEVAWSPSSIPADDGFAPGREAVAFQSGPFSAGLWERDRQDRDFDRGFDEVAILLEGDVELTMEDGAVLHASQGDVIVTPRGSRGHWTSNELVRKFWAIYEV